MFEEIPVSANYKVNFTDNEPRDVRLAVKFNYDVKTMEPVFYFDVSRPVKKLIMELQVEDGVPLHNVKKCISAQYGDEKKLMGRKCVKSILVTIHHLQLIDSLLRTQRYYTITKSLGNG